MIARHSAWIDRLIDTDQILDAACWLRAEHWSISDMESSPYAVELHVRSGIGLGYGAMSGDGEGYGYGCNEEYPEVRVRPGDGAGLGHGLGSGCGTGDGYAGGSEEYVKDNFAWLHRCLYGLSGG